VTSGGKITGLNGNFGVPNSVGSPRQFQLGARLAFQGEVRARGSRIVVQKNALRIKKPRSAAEEKKKEQSSRAKWKVRVDSVATPGCLEN
jgi:hypothetical protein